MATPDEKQTVEIQHDEARRRFEARLDGDVALLNYRYEADAIVFTHTEVPQAFEGRGIASQLARAALEFAKNQNLPVVARCPFVAGYVKRHPEYQPLLKR